MEIIVHLKELKGLFISWSLKNQEKKVGVALAEFCCFKLSLWQVLGESSFKGPEVLLNKYYYH